jgi:TRAP-type C4-dicarboxylate transport system permease small subunit
MPGSSPHSIPEPGEGMKSKKVQGLSFFDRVLDTLGYATGVIIVGTILAVCVNVIMRYVFNRPIVGVEEISAYLLLYVTFLGAAWLLRMDGHVRVDVFLVRVRPRTRSVLSIISSLLGILVFGVITLYGVKVTWAHFASRAYFGTILEFPKGPVFIVIPLGSLLLFLEFVRNLIKNIEKVRTEEKAVQTGQGT